MLAFNRYALYYLFLYGETGIPKEDTGKMADQQGSNIWAIRPSQGATGHAMLLINPRQPFFGPGQWYEGHIFETDQGSDWSKPVDGSTAETEWHAMDLRGKPRSV
jgi:acyl-homoserine lactone acylase PvdQ